jgi:hypothetical protein
VNTVRIKTNVSYPWTQYVSKQMFSIREHSTYQNKCFLSVNTVRIKTNVSYPWTQYVSKLVTVYWKCGWIWLRCRLLILCQITHNVICVCTCPELCCLLPVCCHGNNRQQQNMSANTVFLPVHEVTTSVTAMWKCWGRSNAISVNLSFSIFATLHWRTNYW